MFVDLSRDFSPLSIHDFLRMEEGVEHALGNKTDNLKDGCLRSMRSYLNFKLFSFE